MLFFSLNDSVTQNATANRRGSGSGKFFDTLLLGDSFSRCSLHVCSSFK